MNMNNSLMTLLTVFASYIAQCKLPGNLKCVPTFWGECQAKYVIQWWLGYQLAEVTFKIVLAVVVTVAVGVVLLSTVWIVHKFRQPNNRRDPGNIQINNNINNQQQQAQQL
jgi:heme/copper-type cytochrome/quinol oxidase subunit 2